MDILAGFSFNKRVCECLLPANHPSQNIAMYNKTISWKRTTLLLTYWKQQTCSFEFRTLTWWRMRTDRMKKLTCQRQMAFSISWTRQEPRVLVGSSVISNWTVPGSIAASSFFLCHFFFCLQIIIKVRTGKNFKVVHLFGDGLRTWAQVKSIVTSHEVTIGFTKPPGRLL